VEEAVAVVVAQVDEEVTMKADASAAKFAADRKEQANKAAERACRPSLQQQSRGMEATARIWPEAAAMGAAQVSVQVQAAPDGIYTRATVSDARARAEVSGARGESLTADGSRKARVETVHSVQSVIDRYTPHATFAGLTSACPRLCSTHAAADVTLAAPREGVGRMITESGQVLPPREVGWSRWQVMMRQLQKACEMAKREIEDCGLFQGGTPTRGASNLPANPMVPRCSKLPSCSCTACLLQHIDEMLCKVTHRSLHTHEVPLDVCKSHIGLSSSLASPQSLPLLKPAGLESSCAVAQQPVRCRLLHERRLVRGCQEMPLNSQYKQRV